MGPVDGAESRVREVVQAYIDATRRCDADRMRGVFHPRAAMNGFLGEEAMVGSPEPFFDALASQTVPQPGYRAVIESVEVNGRTATATLREDGCLGASFVNHFHLVELDSVWCIVAKLFERT